MSYKKKSKKVRRHIDSAIVHVKSTFNNTLVSVTTMDGEVLLRSSAGKLAYKGARKGTPFAASQVGSSLVKSMLDLGIRRIEVYLRGPGSGRDSVIRALQAGGLGVELIADVTPLPHNGVRPAKKRRV